MDQVLSWRATRHLMAALLAVGGLSACGGGGDEAPPAQTYTIGGTVAVGSATGLVLQNNGADDLTISSDGSFTFSTRIASGGSYNVTVKQQPTNPAETCTVSGGSGAVGSSNVTGISISCTVNTYTVGGTVSGLTASGLTVGDGANTISVSAGATSFTLPNLVASGGSYSVSVISQPATQLCTVASGTGVVGSANVASVQVNCVDAHSVGGIITGLIASGLVLANGIDTVSPAVGASTFVFSTKVAVGASYAVTANTQPTGHQCHVTNGTGVMASADVTNVLVSCGLWTWNGGSKAIDAVGVYGSKGVAGSGNNPGERRWGTVSWRDASGNFWLFGGHASNLMNDLWKYTPSAGQWTWISGSQTPASAGVYGTQGVPGAGNVPGARGYAVSWTDASGNLWLFGGYGHDSTGTPGYLNDLWMFSPATGQWRWVGGAATAWQSGGPTPPTGTPGARHGAVSWTDPSGAFWLFGGLVQNVGDTNDLWNYDADTNAWTLVSGSPNVMAAGVYGTQGTAAAGNVPGGRQNALSAIDAGGNLWLFGGSGVDSAGTVGVLNDLWKFSPTSNQWEWVSGSNIVNALSVFTTGTPVPGARYTSAGGMDGLGNFWIFGGNGFDSVGARGLLNDLWIYNTNAGQWIWMGGAQTNAVPATGAYGTQGAGAPGNSPGQRYSPASWIDASGNFWMLGGYGYALDETAGGLNDLWEFAP